MTVHTKDRFTFTLTCGMEIDRRLYAKYGPDAEEINFIETHVKPCEAHDIKTRGRFPPRAKIKTIC